MILGYHIDGLPGVSLDRAVELLDEAGFGSIALPVGGRFLDPNRSDCPKKVDRLADVLCESNFGSIVEVELGSEGRRQVGAPEKSIPSLISADPDRRREYLKQCEYAIDVATMLRSDCVVLRSGPFVFPEEVEQGHDAAWGRLVDSLSELLDYAEERAMPIGFEPGLGMLVDTTDAMSRLLGQVSSSMLRLSLDLAALYFMGETPLAHFLYTWAGRMVNLFLCDVKDSAPNCRLMPGEGELDFSPLFVALDEAGYSGGVHIRFDGSPSGDGAEQMRQAMVFWRQMARFRF